MTKTKRITFCGAIAGLLLVLSGCASTSERSSAQTLKTETTARSHEQPGGAASSRKQLPELNEASGLNDYLAYAALNNPQLESAFNRWKAALEMVTPARTLPDPRFSYGYYIQEVETRVGPQEDSLGISQTFPWFGKLKLQGQAAQSGADAAQQQYESAKLVLFDEVKQAYYELYYLGCAIDITKENVGLLQQFEQIAESKYRAGTAANGDVLKAQVELDKLRDRLRTLEDMQEPTDARLNAALNRPAEAPLLLPGDLGREKPSAGTGQLIAQLTAANSGLNPNASSSIQGLLTELQTNNPDLKSLDYQAERDQRNIALAKKQFFPDVTLGVNDIVTGPARAPNVTDSGKDAVIAGFSVNIPLWWGKYRAEERAAQSQYRATRAARQNQANLLSTHLKLAAFKYQDAERKVVLYRDALIPKADENIKVIQRSYQADKSDFLSLIDAERVLLEFQLTYERAVADREQGLATVEKLVGGETTPPTSENEKEP
jgi:cobalt-zinc-cadmium efflux system outer membrane protein